MNFIWILAIIVSCVLILGIIIIIIIKRMSIKDRVIDIQHNGKWRMIKKRLNGNKIEYENLDGRQKTIFINDKCVVRMQNGGRLMIIKDGKPFPFKVNEKTKELDLDWITDEVLFEMINSEHARMLASGKAPFSTMEKIMMFIGFIILIALQVIVIAKIYNADKVVTGGVAP